MASYAQNPDSLQQLLRTTQNLNQKIYIYESLIKYYQSNNPQKAYELSKQLMQLSEKNKKTEGKAIAFYNYGVYWLLQGKYDSVKHYARQTTQNAKIQRHERATAMGINLSALYFWHTGKMDSAINYHLQALKIRERIRDTAGLGASYLGLGSLYTSLKKNTDALYYLEKGVSIGKQINNKRLMVNSMHMMANIYASQNDYKKALEIDQQALPLAIQSNSQRGISQIYSNMANCYGALKQFKKSVEYHYKVLEIDKSFKDDRQIGDTYYNLANTYYQWKHNEKAISLAQQAISLFKKTKYSEGLSYALPLLANSYEIAGNYKQAFKIQQEYIAVQQQLFNEKSDKNISVLKTQYETEKKEQRIKTLNQQNAIQQLKLRQKDIGLTIACIMVVFVGIVAYLIINRRKLKAKAELQTEIIKQQDMASKAILDAEERERRRIAGDLHDGVGQMLSAALMNLNALFFKLDLKTESSLQAEKALALVNESYDEMRSISHQMMPNALLKSGLASAVKEFIGKLDKDKLKVTLETAGLNQRLDEQTETVIYRIIQETVTNVVKHANASKLDIQIIKDEDGVAVTIEDNGKGFNKNDVKAGIGLSNIYSRAEFLKGTVDIDSTEGKGTLVAIHLP
ncbi:ATP-binding protein [Pedobacter sp.]